MGCTETSFTILETINDMPESGSLREVTPIDWDTGCAIFLGYFFGWKISFWVYFIACNKFLGQDFSLE